MHGKVYFRGRPFDYRAVDISGRLHYILYDNGVVEHVLPPAELDKRPTVSHILDRYYNTTSNTVMLDVRR